MDRQNTGSIYTEVIINNGNYITPHRQVILAVMGGLFYIFGKDILNENGVFNFKGISFILFGAFLIFMFIINTSNWILSKIRGIEVKSYVQFWDEYLIIDSTATIKLLFWHGRKIYYKDIEFASDLEIRGNPTIKIFLNNGNKKSFGVLSGKGKLSQIKSNFRKKGVDFI